MLSCPSPGICNISTPGNLFLPTCVYTCIYMYILHTVVPSSGVALPMCVQDASGALIQQLSAVGVEALKTVFAE